MSTSTKHPVVSATLAIDNRIGLVENKFNMEIARNCIPTVLSVTVKTMKSVPRVEGMTRTGQKDIAVVSYRLFRENRRNINLNIYIDIYIYIKYMYVCETVRFDIYYIYYRSTRLFSGGFARAYLKL